MIKGNIDLKCLWSLIQRFPKWLILSHEKPDGDTLGSCSALMCIANALGKIALWGGADGYPPQYLFLPESARYTCLERIPPGFDGVETCVIAIDISNVERSVPGSACKDKKFTLVNIDHHGDNSLYGDYNYVDSLASATGEIIWEMFSQRKGYISPEVATGLYTAIVTDCGNFTFINTSPRTHRIAAELLEVGVDPAEIENYITNHESIEKLHLWGIALQRVRVLMPGVALMWLRLEDFVSTGAALSETESLVNYLLRVEGIEFAILLVETVECSEVKASFRSRGPVSARKIAQQWGGGGHIPAAGCKLSMSLDEAIEAIKSKVKRYND